MNYDFDVLYPSRFLKAETLGNQPKILTIKEVTVQELGVDKEKKVILAFYEIDEQMVCNITNGRALKDLYGKNSAAWVNKQVEVYSERVPFGNRIVNGLRLRAPRRPEPPVPVHAEPEPAVDPDFNDDVPF